MSRRVASIVLVLGLLALAPAGATATPSHPGLWATVNLCDSPAKPGAVGVRVSIPREKGAPQQWARIRLQWFDGTKRAWRLVRSGGDAGFARIGIGARLVQGGTTFTFPPPKPGSRIVLRGVVTFEWREDGEVARRARKSTTAAHPNTAGSDPAGFTAATCSIT